MTEQEQNKFWGSFVVRDGCWIWTRTRFSQGYGSFSISGKARRAHRVAYELIYNVTITPNQFLHHTCRNKLCVNPEHLQITNQAEHMDSATFGNKDKTHCPHGHEYTPGNICWNKNGSSRECRTCKYQRTRRHHHRLKAAYHQAYRERLKQIALKHGWDLDAPPDSI